MSDSIDCPAFSNVPNIGTFSVEDAFFLVFESTPAGATKASAKCIPAASMLTIFAPSHPELSVTFADNIPEFNGDNQTLRLPNAPRLNLTAPANGRTYTFTSGDGQQTQDVFIPSQVSLAQESAGSQTYRWRFTKQSDTPNDEATSLVIFIPTLEDSIWNQDYYPENGEFAQYNEDGALKVRALLFRTNNTTDYLAISYGTSGVTFTQDYDGLESIRALSVYAPRSLSDGNFAIYHPNSSVSIHNKTKAVTDNVDGIVVIPMTSTQRDELTVNNYNRLILNTTTGELNFHNGTEWRKLHDSPI